MMDIGEETDDFGEEPDESGGVTEWICTDEERRHLSSVIAALISLGRMMSPSRHRDILEALADTLWAASLAWVPVVHEDPG
jgi:hypothetical protein